MICWVKLSKHVFIFQMVTQALNAACQIIRIPWQVSAQIWIWKHLLVSEERKNMRILWVVHITSILTTEASFILINTLHKFSWFSFNFRFVVLSSSLWIVLHWRCFKLKQIDYNKSYFLKSWDKFGIFYRDNICCTTGPFKIHGKEEERRMQNAREKRERVS